MQYTVQQIAEALGADCEGDLGLAVERAAEPADAGPTDLAMAMSPKYAEAISVGSARAAVLWEGADWQGLGLKAAIFVPRPRMAMAGITAMLDRGQGIEPGIHPSAVIDPTAEIGEGAAIGPLAVVGARVRIGNGAVIGPHCVIGMDAVLGRSRCSARDGEHRGTRANRRSVYRTTRRADWGRWVQLCHTRSVRCRECTKNHG